MEPSCQFCGLVDKLRCRSIEASEDCPHAPVDGKAPVVATGPLRGFIRQHYRVIYADPPWAYKTFSEAKRGTVPHRSAEKPYESMTREELLDLPVDELAHPEGCVLHMWTISSHVDQAFELAAKWGFTFKSLGFIWVKTQKSDPEKPKMGMGKWLRQEAEVCLLFTRGKPKRTDAGVRQVVMEPARQHSRKPDEVIERIEKLSEGPYLEMFSRTNRKGWDAMGDQVGKFGGEVDEETAAAIAELI